MRAKFTIALSCIGLVLGWGSLVAHHAFASEFDPEKPITLRGTVTKIEWVNPHTWLYLDVKGQDNHEAVNWAIEGGPPNALIRRGLRRDSLPVGVQVTVDGFQAKNGQHVANGKDITWPGGIKIFMGTPGTGAPGDPKR